MRIEQASLRGSAQYAHTLSIVWRNFEIVCLFIGQHLILLELYTSLQLRNWNERVGKDHMMFEIRIKN